MMYGSARILGLCRMVQDDANMAFERYLPFLSEDGGDRVNSIFEGPSGILWVGTSKGLYRRIRTENGSIEFIAAEDNNNWIDAVYEDNAGTLWVGQGQVYKTNRRVV